LSRRNQESDGQRGASAPLLEITMKKLEYFAKYQEYRRAATSRKDRVYYNEMACIYLAKFFEMPRQKG